MDNQVKNLLYFCVVNKNWKPDLEEYPIQDLIKFKLFSFSS